jgi:hypothetical protein
LSLRQGYIPRLTAHAGNYDNDEQWATKCDSHSYLCSQPHRDALHRRGIHTQLAKRRTPHGSGLGRTRWVVERTLAWLHRFRRLNMRYERRPCIHEAFLMLGCSLICWNFLKPLIYF